MKNTGLNCMGPIICRYSSIMYWKYFLRFMTIWKDLQAGKPYNLNLNIKEKLGVSWMYKMSVCVCVYVCVSHKISVSDHYML